MNDFNIRFPYVVLINKVFFHGSRSCNKTVTVMQNLLKIFTAVHINPVIQLMDMSNNRNIERCQCF